MPNNLNNPREYDIVLGGDSDAPINAVVLGGIEGVKQKLLAKAVEHKISALSEALSYGEEGLSLVLQALSDPEEQVHRAAYNILNDRQELEIKIALNKHIQQCHFVRFDGLYQTEPISWKKGGYNSKFLRFYQNGTVLYTSVVYDEPNPAEHIAQWFNENNDIEKKGVYSIEANNIKFSIKSISQIDYWGQIERYGDSIGLQCYSNKHYYRRIIKYNFVHVPDIQ